MQRCARCGAVSPDTARTCQRCGASFQRQGPVQRSSNVRSTQTAPGTVPSKKKQRSFLVSLLALLGIRYDPQKGSWGCAFLPATISVALVIVVVGGIIVGPVLKLIPPFSPGLTVIGNIAPGASVIVHGANFPPGSHINLTLDGTSVALVPTSHRSTFQSLYDLSLSVAHANPLQQAEQPSASTGNIIVSNDGTFDAQVDGTITNDKFCMSRTGRLRLSWWRLPLSARQAVEYPSEGNNTERCPQEDTHEETAVDGAPSQR